MSKKQILLICRKSPYGSSIARDGLNIALAFAAFDLSITIIFTEDGVFQLLPDQSSKDIQCKSQEKILNAFPLYGIATIFIDQESLKSRSISPSQLNLEGTLASKETLANLIDQSEIIFNF